jgi:uncharacterized protein
MPQVTRVYVDSNVFIHLFERSDELSDQLGELFLAEHPRAEPFLTTSELTVAELLVGPMRREDDRLIQIYENWSRSNDYVSVGPVSLGVLMSAARLRARNTSLKLPDAIHLSTAMHFRCSHFLTADKRLSGRYELTEHRFGSFKGPFIVDILRLELEVVSGLLEEAAQ